MDFYIGWPMKINGTIVRCWSPDPFVVESGHCTEKRTPKIGPTVKVESAPG
jgi:hypothetical protein